MKSIAKKLNIESSAMFIGYASEEEKIKILQLSDVFVFPSLMEGFGLAPAEAMSCGIPTIVSDRGSLPEVVGGGGIVVELDSQKWAEKIEELKKNDDLRKELSEKGITRANSFNWDNVSNKIEASLKKLTGIN
jgi:glycosyltransferase involved in cell wall biosynthesis